MPINHNQPIKKLAQCSSLVLLTSLMSSCLLVPWDKNKHQDEPPLTRATESKKDVDNNPDSTTLRKDLYINRESAASELLAQAEQARTQGDFEQAKSLYKQLLSFDNNNQSALFNIEELEKEIEQAKRLEKATELADNNQIQQAKNTVHDVLLENPQSKLALKLDNDLNGKLGTTNAEPPQLKPTTDKPISLELRDANIKAVFEALSRATGINFILDKDIKPETKATIFIKKLPIDDAIDMVLSSNGLQKKALSENTALVFPSLQQKLKDYQDLKIRSFYLNNTNAKQVAGMLKSMLKTKDIFIDERINMLVMRDTPEAVRIAEKLVTAVDIADSEVMLDIEVLEVSRSRIQELGIIYPNRLSVIGADTGLTLEALKGVNSSAIGVSPNPGLNFRKTVGDVNLLSNPRIRVKNNEKAKILVGDKVPIITTTSTANVGVSENVTYIDVGLKLDVEPKITLDDFVNIKVGLEVSSLGERTVTSNGANVFTIGTRSANTSLRLKDGETQILAGLIQDNERRNSDRLPGLGDIPLIGRLFANQEDRKSKTEIVLAITPRIINNLALPSAEVSEYWSGTESVITDKPRKLIPAFSGSTNAPMTPLERLREQRRERQLQLNNPQESGDDSSITDQVQTQDNAQITPNEAVVPNANTTPQPGVIADPQTAPLIDTVNPPVRF